LTSQGQLLEALLGGQIETARVCIVQARREAAGCNAVVENLNG
jgi:hypothetical protein